MANVTIVEFFKREGNESCFDCGAPSEEMFSVNYGVALCEKCADIHNSEDYSRAISAMQIIFYPYVQCILPYAGNNAYRAYLRSLQIDSEAPGEFKYRIKAAQHYQDLLYEADKTEVPPIEAPQLPLEEALILMPPGRYMGQGGALQQAMRGAADVTVQVGVQVVSGLNEFTKTPIMRAIEESSIGLLKRLEANVNWLFGVQEEDNTETEMHPV